MAAIPGSSDAVSGTRNRDAVVIDLGSKSKKQIRKLQKGEGPLLGEVDQVLNELRTSGVLSGAAQPIILIVREKDDSGVLPLFGILGGK